MADQFERPTPAVEEEMPGGWIPTPSEQTPGTSRTTSYISETSGTRTPTGPAIGTAAHQRLPSSQQGRYYPGLAVASATTAAPAVTLTESTLIEPRESLASQSESLPTSNTSTAVPSPENEDAALPLPAEKKQEHPTEEVDDRPYTADGEDRSTALRPAPASRFSTTQQRPKRPGLGTTASGRQITEEELFRSLSRRRSSRRGVSRAATATDTKDGAADASRATTHDDDDAEQQEIERLMAKMFGKTRQENSEEEKTRHLGVVWKNLTVKGMGLGAALQETTGDFFLNLPRFLKNMITKGPKAAAGKPPVRTLIDDFSGCIKPGEMLLVLGRPGSGCSTFLKMLGNQRFGFEDVEGEVTYGGTDAKTMGRKYRGEIIYNPEDDLHYATLKVKQTLKFALKTRTPGKESRNEGESKSDYVNEFLRVVSKLFWIEHTMGTKVGNEYIRGVSGGERKRVSIAEAMITKASVQAWDNSTKGLDASTALEYVSSLRSLTNMAHISTAVALYQAGESLYDRFDKVLLIDGGECCYFGPAEEAVGYFKSLGFAQPERWTSADFITSVADEHERHIQDGYEKKIPRTPKQFAKAFRDSEQAKNNFAEIEEFERESQRMAEERRAAQSKATKKKNYTIPFHQQVWACTKRQALVMIGDPQSLGGKWGGILFQAIIVGSLFFNLQPVATGAFTRGGVLFFALLFNALLALAELTAAFESKPILLKHKAFSFYRPSAYALAQTVVDIPLVLIQCTIFDIVVYFMANLQRTPSQFFISLLFLWIITMTMYAFFRAAGALLGSLDAATRVTGVAIQILVVYSGYIIPPSKMKPWFAWLRWINPVQYGFESLMANEFYNLEIQCVPPYIVPQIPGAQEQYQSCTLQGSQPGSLVVQGSDYILEAFTYSRSHLWRNFGIIAAFFGFFVFLTCLGMELEKPNKGGGAVTIYRRGQVPEQLEKAIETGDEKAHDEEMGEKGDDSDLSPTKSLGSDQDAGMETGVAKNETIFTFQNVDYTIPYEGGERHLLEGVQGIVRPGKLTALMGASGAGKTTLLNVLAQRIRFGVVTGDFLVDGQPLPKSFQRSSGFAEQQDVHESTATVREAFRFSAKLRQPKEIPLQEKYDYCEKIIDLLEMRDIAGAAIGEIGNGLNAEQRKRLTIGVELCSKPELLMFLDEPTSGLDSGAAFNVVRFLRKLADAGQAILCTIHQPSSVLFEHFDRLLLLKSGGRTVYHGDLGHDSRTLIDYFESNGAAKCKSKQNPAEYMLEAIGAGNPDYEGKDWGDVWRDSKQNSELTEEIQKLTNERQEKRTTDESHDDREYAMPLSTQITTVTHRSFVAMWRTPSYVTGMFILHIVTGLFNTFTFWMLGNSQIDMQSRLFSAFMTLTISPPLIQQLQPRFLNMRNIFETRESNAKIYNWVAFVVGAVVSEIPYRLAAGTIYWCCWYWGVGFPRGTFTSAVMWIWIMLFELYYLGFGQAIAAFSPNELLASILVPLFFLFVVSFCGVVVPAMALPYFWRSWMYWLTPFHYLLEGMLSIVTTGLPIQCDASELAIFPAPPGQTCDSYAGAFAQQSGGYVEVQPDGLCGYCQFATGDAWAASFSVYRSNLWRDFGIFWAYILFNFAIVFLCSWLYLSGGRRIKGVASPKARKQKKMREKESKGGAEKV